MEVVLLVLGILLAVLLINILVWIPIVFWLRRRSRQARAQMAEVPKGQPVRLAERAQYFGRQSAGKAQVRGTGELALAADELVFVQWVPRRTLQVPRPGIEAVDTPRAWLGKTTGVCLLCVRWRDGEAVDAAAWQVRELDRWLAALGVDPPA